MPQSTAWPRPRPAELRDRAAASARRAESRSSARATATVLAAAASPAASAAVQPLGFGGLPRRFVNLSTGAIPGNDTVKAPCSPEPLAPDMGAILSSDSAIPPACSPGWKCRVAPRRARRPPIQARGGRISGIFNRRQRRAAVSSHRRRDFHPVLRRQAIESACASALSARIRRRGRHVQEGLFDRTEHDESRSSRPSRSSSARTGSRYRRRRSRRSSQTVMLVIAQSTVRPRVARRVDP